MYDDGSVGGGGGVDVSLTKKGVQSYGIKAYTMSITIALCIDGEYSL